MDIYSPLLICTLYFLHIYVHTVSMYKHSNTEVPGMGFSCSCSQKITKQRLEMPTLPRSQYSWYFQWFVTSNVFFFSPQPYSKKECLLLFLRAQTNTQGCFCVLVTKIYFAKIFWNRPKRSVYLFGIIPQEVFRSVYSTTKHNKISNTNTHQHL